MTTAIKPIGIGEAAPWFRARALNGSQNYAFDIAGGRPILMLLFGSAAQPACADALAKVLAHRDLFDDVRASFYGVTVDPSDEAQRRIALELPGIRYFLDYDRAVSRLFSAEDGGPLYHAHWILFDRTLRIMARFRLDQSDVAIDAFKQVVERTPAPDWAPVVMVPDVIEADVCRQLIDLYESRGGTASGVMREIDGKTTPILDAGFKVRSDCLVEPGPLAEQLIARLFHRLSPMIQRSFQFEATRVERLTIGCYDAAEGGHFKAHRDNTTKGTAHRKFAVTINLNAEEYEGGDLRFPEFGPRTYRAPTGGAVVFSCALLHQATPVTRGRRFALLPFLYDEAGQLLRDENSVFLAGPSAESVGA